MIDSSALQRYSLFGGLEKEQLELVRPLLTLESYLAGDDIIAEGKENDRIRFIIDGRVAVIKGGVILAEFGEGDAFGEMEVLEIMPAAATTKALTSVRVAAISNKSLRELYREDLKTYSLLIMNLARDLSRRLRLMDERIAGGKN